ncbi:hypothetical protein N7451_012216 [Penicillium sp. IBT 35674x]|nr:hypothetical protein N7451_012216 [Penicillium sp. IBT 35674x]
MVTLNHQNFWQPAPSISAVSPPTNTEKRTAEAVTRLATLAERCEAESYTLDTHVPEVSESRDPSRAVSPELYLNDTPATGTYPEYPEEVALYPSSRGSDTPSVTGLEGPGTTRVFDVFEDESDRPSEHLHRDSSSNRSKQISEDPCVPTFRRRHYQTPRVANANKSLAGRVSHLSAEDSSNYTPEALSAGNLLLLRNTITYLKRASNVTSAEARFSNDFPNMNEIAKENLAVLQVATKTLQHAYGIIATSTTAIDVQVREEVTVQPRSTVTRHKWTMHDERRLLKLRDAQKLSWRQIHKSFPERTMGAVKTRYFLKSARQSDSSSSKENRSVHSQQRNRTPTMRRSPRLNRASNASIAVRNTGRGRKSHSHDVRCPQKSIVSNQEAIDPRLRSYGNS